MIHSDSVSWLQHRDAEGSTPGRSATLELMLPKDLPAELSPGPESVELLRSTLVEFLRVLGDAEPGRRPARVRALLEALGPSDGRIAEVRETSIPVEKAEVDDFDRYFGVRRIRTGAPDVALLRGLLHTSLAVLALASRGPDLPPAELDRQIAGFAAHARLLARIYGLGSLP